MLDLFPKLPESVKKDPPVKVILKQCRKAFMMCFGLTIIIELMSITPMLYMMNMMDHVLSSHSMVTLVSLTVMIAGVYLFWSAMDWIRSRLMIRLSLRIDWDLADKVFDASFRRYVGRKNINVSELLADLSSLRQFFTGRSVFTLMQAPFAFLFIAIGGLFHPYLALFAFCASVLMVIISYLTAKITTPILKAANEANTEASRLASGSLRHAETTLALGMLSGVRNKWYDQHRIYLTNQVNASEASGLTGGASGYLSKLMPSLQMGLGAFLSMEGLISGGMIMAASMLISKSVAPIQALIGSWKEIVNARSAYERLNELLETDLLSKQRMKLPPPVGHLELDNAVGVPPGHDKAVLSDIKFELQPGQVLAVVGPSAAGKTSLVKLLLGVWAPKEGTVKLDGVNISEWDHDEVGPLVGYVPQEIEFFEGTVAENIARLGEVIPEKVVEAAKLIEMHDVILGFPKGYDTMLGDSGFAPSGGQRQRLAIARAIYGMPKFVVMDEPNSNLDELGETALINCVQALKDNGGTVVITTHRPRLVNTVDMMLVLKEGKQVVFGAASDLLEAVRRLQVVPEEEGAAGSESSPPDPAAPILSQVAVINQVGQI